MDYLLYEQNGNVATITINREKALNALNSQVLDELNATLDAVDLATVRGHDGHTCRQHDSHAGAAI